LNSFSGIARKKTTMKTIKFSDVKKVLNPIGNFIFVGSIVATFLKLIHVIDIPDLAISLPPIIYFISIVLCVVGLKLASSLGKIDLVD